MLFSYPTSRELSLGVRQMWAIRQLCVAVVTLKQLVLGSRFACIPAWSARQLWAGGPSLSRGRAVVCSACCREWQLLGAWGRQETSPWANRRLASWDPRDRDKQIGGLRCCWEFGADCIQVSVGRACVVGWRCCTLRGLPLESRLLITLDHVGFSTQVLLEFSGVLSVLCLVMCLHLSTYVKSIHRHSKKGREPKIKWLLL